MALHCLKKRLQVLDSVLGWERMGWGRNGALQRKSVYSFSSLDFVPLPLEESKVTEKRISSGHQDLEHDILLSWFFFRGPIGIQMYKGGKESKEGRP